MRFWQYLWYLVLDGYKNALLANSVENMIPGVYEVEWQLQEQIMRDTLTITCLSTVGNVYEVCFKMEQIDRTENVQKIVRVRLDCWKGFYDGRVRQLVDMNLDRMVSFLPEEHKAIYENRDLFKRLVKA
jgi:hypothetical protein